MTNRNYYLLTKIYGKDNVYVCSLTTEDCDSTDHLVFVKNKMNTIQKFMGFLMLHDIIISAKSFLKHVNSMVNNINPDLIIYDGSYFGQIIKHIIAKEIKQIIFFHNIEAQMAWERATKFKKWWILQYLAVKYNEGKMLQAVNNYICINKRDIFLLEKIYGKYTEMVLSVSFIDNFKESVSAKSEESYILFVGSYFRPNLMGIDWFIKNVAPKIKYNIKVIGLNMEKIKNQYNCPNVEIIGGVDEVSSYYNNADAVIMPIFMGGGMKVKTAEALMYGKTIFATKEAFEGYQIEGINNLVECNTAEEFIKNLNSYYDLSSHTLVNKEIRDLFLEKYETDSYIEKFKNYINSI